MDPERSPDGAAPEQLLQSVALYRTLAAHLPDTSVFLLDRDLRILLAEGEGVRRLPWIDDRMFVGELLSELQGRLPADVLAMSQDCYRGALAGERRDFAFTSAGLTYEVTAVPVRDADGKVQSALAVVRDVSAQRGAEADRARLAALVDHSPDAVIAVDDAFRITAYNPAAAGLFALPPAAALGRSITDLTDTADSKEDRLYRMRRALVGETIHTERMHTRVDGSTIALASIAAPIRTAGGISGAVITIRDVTAQWQSRLALERDGRRARLLSQASLALDRSLEPSDAVTAMAQLIVPELGDLCVVIATSGDPGTRLISVGAVEAAVGNVVRQAFEDDPLTDVVRAVSDPALAAGRNVLLEPVVPELIPSWAEQFPALRDELARLPISSGMIVPLRSAGTTVGLVLVASLQAQRHFTQDDLGLTREIADLVSQTMENTRLLAAAQRAQAIAEAATHELLAAEQRFSAAFANAPIGMALLSTKEGQTSRIEAVNPALCELTGFDSDALHGCDLVETLVHPSERAPARRDLAWLLSGELSPTIAERHYVRRDGGDIWVQTSVARLSDTTDDSQVVLQVQDITERRHHEDQLRRLADHDHLTGLFNRRRFVEELDREAAAARRRRAPTALLLIDIDHFKSVNDTYGHAAGDEVLAGVATALTERARQTDIVGRLGGDEFAVVLSQSDGHDAQVLATALLKNVQCHGLTAGGPGAAAVTVSVGIRVLGHDESLTAEELIVEADVAMYEAKEGGRNRLAEGRRGNPEPTRFRRRLAMADRIRLACAGDDGFLLYEQPIRSLHSDAVERTEILVRMRDDDGEILPPSAFLPVADRFDLLAGIDRWVISHAVELLSMRQAAGIGLGMEVNLSGTSIGDPAVVDFIASTVRNARIDPGALTFEMTETEALVNVDRARVLARQLSALGCQFALDDFGSGFGSFYHLKHLPFDIVKIDGNFISALRTSRTDQLTVESIVTITHGLEKQTVAEWVGDAGTTEILRRYGVDFAQGFHIGKPSPAVVHPPNAVPQASE